MTAVLADIPRGVVARSLEQTAMPSAAWADPSAILSSKKLAYDPAYDGHKILLGALGNKLIGLNDDRHMLTVAGSRAGKSVNITCNLIFYQGSALVIDPKAELANRTARRRATDLGQKVYVLDPFDRASDLVKPLRATYNPLSILRLDSPTILEDAGLITDALVIPSTSGDPHWDESARIFLEGIILHVATFPAYEGERNLVTVYKLVTRGTLFREGGNKNGGGAAELDGMAGLIAEMFHNAGALFDRYLGESIEAAAFDFFDRPEKERGSVLSTLRRHVKFLSYKAMQKVLSGNGDFDLTDLKTAPNGMTVYLCLPAGRLGTCNRWLRLFINLALESMERIAAKPKIPVLFCMDEFPILGHMKHIEDAAGQIAGYGVKLWPIIQDLSQLKSLYKDRWETFMGNAGVMQFFGNNDVTTLEWITRRLGKTVVSVVTGNESFSEQHTRQANAAANGDSGGFTSGHSAKLELHDLVTPEEASRIFSREDKKKRQLVIWAGRDPMILERVEYYPAPKSSDQSSSYNKNPFEDLFREKYDEF